MPGGSSPCGPVPGGKSRAIDFCGSSRSPGQGLLAKSISQTVSEPDCGHTRSWFVPPPTHAHTQGWASRNVARPKRLRSPPSQRLSAQRDSTSHPASRRTRHSVARGVESAAITVGTTHVLSDSTKIQTLSGRVMPSLNTLEYPLSAPPTAEATRRDLREPRCRLPPRLLGTYGERTERTSSIVRRYL